MLRSVVKGASHCLSNKNSSSLLVSQRLLRSSQQHYSTGPTFQYEDLFQVGKDGTEYRLVSKDHISTISVKDEKSGETKEILKVEPEALSKITQAAISDIQYLLRPAHLKQLSNILKDPEASQNDRFVAMTLLKNAVIASGRKLPGCQDTGTAIVMGKKGQFVWTDGKDEKHISEGVFNTYTKQYLRYSQVAPLNMYEEKNTACNLPAQIDLYATDGDEYKFLFIAKGGGSANKTYLYQQTKALLNPASLMKFLEEKIKSIGTSACPPYHLAIVIGGLSAELTLKTVKLASTKYYDELPTSGSPGGRAFRDVELEKEILKLTQKMGIGAQFGGKYFCHDIRVIRLPRHGASCPVGIGVSCSADRQVKGKITKDGIYLERLETDPAQYLPEVKEKDLSEQVVKIDLNRPMKDILSVLSKYPIKTRLSLSGPLIVARDIAHAKLKERLDRGEGLPDYVKNHIIYYAGPAKTPEGYASGSFGPTTAGRMDSYVDLFQKNGGSLITLAKGNRSREVTKACSENGGFYLGSIGGPAAILAANNIKKVEVVEYAELGMEAIWKIEVEDFPAFIIVDDKGADFFKDLN
ncbi:fumarate hydratase class I [Naegleria gruberi]|uniref:fumarate hydratase n=1 Tax=Naegleria gruberi TaxID=5762 RepID=D2UY48_NAEGR|nr:fumarate hydratase class I [Naegleria gruberi]EFC50412.1 fumarate hydratase class I [Naegleria gruberi]|eukprot:XP_002683156.1 fumarate hydratase class I [Naegleria gruberi strain NEG-M]